MYCNICGNEIAEGESFCSACGEPVSVGYTPKDNFETEQSYEPQTVGVRSSYNNYNGVQSFSDNVEEPQFGEASSYKGSQSVNRKKKGPALIIIAVVLLIAAGAGVFFFVFGGKIGGDDRSQQLKGRWKPLGGSAFSSGALVIDDSKFNVEINGRKLASLDYKLDGDSLHCDCFGTGATFTFADVKESDFSSGGSPFGSNEAKWYTNGKYLIIGQTVYQKE